MPCSFVVVKLLMLKYLLANIAGLSAYEFGYHPSAEEFDSLMRETKKTWTRQLLASARRRSWTVEDKPSFVPKYNFEKERVRHLVAATVTPWQPHADKKVGQAPNHEDDDRYDQHDQQGASLLGGSNIGSSLDFTMFSDETSPPILSQELAVHMPPSSEPSNGTNDNVFSTAIVTDKPQIGVSKPLKNIQILKIGAGATNDSSKPPKSVLHNLHNHTENLPIFFTNPVTGIVYAITEVGRVDGNALQGNDTIPIYITKEQYERDMFLLRKDYENRCRLAVQQPNKTDSVLSTTAGATTIRPHIIRLQRPKQTVSKLPNAKLPGGSSSLQHPAPVLVQSEVSVSDQIKLPTLQNGKRHKKKKKKVKHKRPGRKPQIVNVAPTELPLPHIVRGTAPISTLQPAKSAVKLATQLERPTATAPSPVFNKRPIAATSGYMSPISSRSQQQDLTYRNHRMRRAVVGVQETSKLLTNAQSSQLTNFASEAAAHTSHRLPKLPGTRKRITHYMNTTMPNSFKSWMINRTRQASHLFTTKSNASRKAIDLLPTHSTQAPHTHGTHSSPYNATDHKVLQDPKISRKRKKKDDEKSRKRQDKEVDASFDIFDLIDSDEDDYESYYDDDDEEDQHKGLKRVKKKFKKKQPQENRTRKDTTDSLGSDEVDLKEQVEQGNSSSAEEGADFGALEEEDEMYQQTENTDNSEDFSYNTKSSSGKKRIRRRPVVQSYEEYADGYGDGDGDDEEGESGIGGFFRMIFYPVEVVMGKILDMVTGEKGESAEEDKPQFPTYTQYNSAGRPLESTEDGQSSSLGDWFGSLFSFNRKTKKIGSTTTTPPQLPTPAPTERAGWLESWFGFSGPATTEASYEDYDDGDKWFFGWFDTAPKAKRRASTTTSPTTAPTPQVPILTIVDPLRNPQNWIGILAHHIVNATSTTTSNPLIEAITRATSMTTSTADTADIPVRVFYDKYQIWRLKPQDDTQVKALNEYKHSGDGTKLQWLKGPSLRGLTDVLVPPKMLIDFRGVLNFEAIAHEVLIFDVGKAIAYERSKEDFFQTALTERPTKHGHKKKPLNPMSWHRYYAYDDIIKYLESIRLKHPQIVELIHIGRSFEGRPLVIAKLELKRPAESGAAYTPTTHKKLKYKRKSGHANAVLIESGTHGLEWIGPATTTWMINELLRIMKTNKTDIDTDFIKKTTWYIMPVLNPDGYVFSHDYDRFWKKSRSRHVSRPDDILSSAMSWLQQKKVREKVCYGVDLDRNWHYQWGRRGSSKSPCNEFYAGPVPFSEPETKALSEFLMDYRKQIKLFVSMQAYGQIISYPLRTNVSFNSERMDDFLDVAMVGTDGLRKKGSKSRYKVDSTSDLIENRSGCSDAFAAYEVGIPFSYTMQLADNGVHGYLLPSSSIEPTARDAFEIITAMLDYI